MNAFGKLLAIATLLSLGACATPQTAALRADYGDLPARAEVADVPFFPQEKFYCGPAATAMTLAWSGLPVTQDDLVPQVYTPGREGTLQPDIVTAMRRNGRLAVQVESLPDILAELAAGRPVLVFQNLALDWYPQWHFAVAIGYDLDDGKLFLRSGTVERHEMSMATFEHTWRRGEYWALVVLKPGQLPVKSDEIAVLRAASGLERVGRTVEAAGAYQTIAGRWPASFPAWMGLGNTHYALDDLPAAESAFRSAVRVMPDGAAPAWNNLAYVLAGDGRRDEALLAARTAVELGGDQAANYRATLEELSQP